MNKINATSDSSRVGLLSGDDIEKQIQNHNDMVIERFKLIDNNIQEDVFVDVACEPHTIIEGVCLLIYNIVGFILLPWYLANSLFIVTPNEKIIFTSFGKIRKVVDKPGCCWVPLLTAQRVMCKLETLQIKGSSVPDLTGSPLHVSVIINYRVQDAIKSVYAVDDYHDYIRNQTLEVMRSSCSKFAYRCNSSSEPSLMKDT